MAEGLDKFGRLGHGNILQALDGTIHHAHLRPHYCGAIIHTLRIYVKAK